MFRVSFPKKGFSLLELLIYIAIFSSMLLAVGSIFLVVVRARASANARVEVHNAARFVAEHIRQSAGEGIGADVDGSCPLNVLTIIGLTSQQIFRIENGVVTRSIGANPAEQLTSGEVVAEPVGQECIFAVVSNPLPAKQTLQMRMKIRYNDQGRPELKAQDVIQTSFSLR